MVSLNDETWEGFRFIVSDWQVGLRGPVLCH